MVLYFYRDDLCGQNHLSVQNLLKQDFKRFFDLAGSIALVLRNGLPELISGFLSLIRYGDDLLLLLGGLTMRRDFSSENEYTKEQNVTSMSIATCEQKKERVVGLWMAVCAITERGNNAEVRRKKNGTFTVYEVKKNIVTVR